ncbi:sugar phosphate isomerase/epimerase family protein [Litchfieldella xinjiangensis]|uniref:sugar phosphate isomerase/epimerase family protein n=1 Tax=Litchfieldella xinjiangensis TaxID=1166948 RepID=UPI0005BA43E8|nr:sugar phosphate isomerase/epimerase family protein [Halomonas xinjiangensis]
MIDLALNTATTRRQWGLREAVEGCKRHGLSSIVPWRDQVLELGLETSAQLLRNSGLGVTGYCRGGMFPANNEAGRRDAIEENRRVIDEAFAIGSPLVVLVCGGLPEGSKDLSGAREMVIDGIHSIMDHARSANIKLAIEPLHPMQAADRSCINTLAQANEICDLLEPSGSSTLGIAMDVYHVWWDPDLTRQLHRAGASRLIGFHLCDWLVSTRHLVTDRGMMGDGIIDLESIALTMSEAGFKGIPEVEIFSEYWWSQPADEVLHTAKERAYSVLNKLSR